MVFVVVALVNATAAHDAPAAPTTTLPVINRLRTARAFTFGPPMLGKQAHLQTGVYGHIFGTCPAPIRHRGRGSLRPGSTQRPVLDFADAGFGAKRGLMKSFCRPAVGAIRSQP